MASTSKNQQPDANLASRMEKMPSMSVKDVKALAASNPQDFDVNARNKHGNTALMFACGRVDEKMVEFLLDQGADPNAQCQQGNTPMHYAVSDSYCSRVKEGKCSRDVRPEIGKVEKRVDILRLLISRGAQPIYNSGGLNPACLAALYKQSDLVNFFVQRNTRYLQLSDQEQIRVLEIIGVVTALDSRDKYMIRDSLGYFSRARSIRKKMKSNACSVENKKSDLAAVFSFFSEKECDCEEWKGIQNDNWAIRTQAFLIAERVLPEQDDLKETYLLPHLLSHARVGIFQFGNIEDRLSQGIQIFEDALQWELNSKLDLGSVLGCILEGFKMKSWENLQLHDKVKGCLPVMYSWLQVFEGASKCRVRKVQEQLLHELGSLLLGLAMSSCHKSSDIFEALLPFGEQVVIATRGICKGRRVASITHHIIVECQGYYPENGVLCSRSSGKLSRVKRLISKLVQCEDATHCNAKGDTMLHSLMITHLTAHPQFLKDVALILIRNGCDPQKRNNRHETWEGKIRYLPYTLRSEYKELKEIITRQTKSVLPLEELAARTILRHNISHEGILPKHLSRIVTGETWPADNSKSDLNDGHDRDSEYDLEYDEEYESDYDSEYDSDFDFLHSDIYFSEDEESSDYGWDSDDSEAARCYSSWRSLWRKFNSKGDAF